MKDRVKEMKVAKDVYVPTFAIYFIFTLFFAVCLRMLQVLVS
jgi:hypothetical protein